MKNSKTTKAMLKRWLSKYRSGAKLTDIGQADERGPATVRAAIDRALLITWFNFPPVGAPCPVDAPYPGLKIMKESPDDLDYFLHAAISNINYIWNLYGSKGLFLDPGTVAVPPEVATVMKNANQLVMDSQGREPEDKPGMFGRVAQWLAQLIK